MNASHVVEFEEKPTADAAEQYVASRRVRLEQRHLRLEAANDPRRTARPQAGAFTPTVLRIADAWGTPRRNEVFRHDYETAEKISIDFAVMQDAAKDGKVLVLTRRTPGTTSGAGWRWNAATRRTRTTTPCRRSTAASRRTTA